MIYNNKKEDIAMDWRLIFEQSKANGGQYLGDELVQRVYKPVDTSWFQKRLGQVREQLKKEMSAFLQRQYR
jgi:hypothetical protein